MTQQTIIKVRRPDGQVETVTKDGAMTDAWVAKAADNTRKAGRGEIIGHEIIEVQTAQDKAEAAMPGLAELRTAQDASYAECERYRGEFERMMSRGDGVGPRPENTKLHERAKELAEKYPRAALYLAAKGQKIHSSDYRKSAAGERAMEIIISGGDLDEARKVLDNWLPADAMWR